MPKGDDTWPSMSIDECLAFADEWSRGMTYHAGSQGWRVVCMLLAEEVRGMREEIAAERMVAEAENAVLKASLRRCLREAEGWLDESRGCKPDDVIGYDGWDDEARQLLGDGG